MTQRAYRQHEWAMCMANAGHCWYCLRPATEAAHIVEASLGNIGKYGFWAIYHRDNLIPTCRQHNDSAMNEARGSVGESEHMAKIIDAIDREGRPE